MKKNKNKKSPVWPFNPLSTAQVSRNESRLTRRMGHGVGAPANPSLHQKILSSFLA
jgi:hypothetical protein